MPSLIPTDHYATVVWLGAVSDRETQLPSQSLTEMQLGFAGFSGEAHAGLTRPSCSRVISQYARNTEIKNARQLSVVSSEELAQIAAAMGIDALSPHLIGASVMIEGIVDWSHVPPSSRLICDAGAGLVVDMENRPCHLPAPYIEADHEGAGKSFKAAAQGKRGVTAYVEREGMLKIGDVMRLHVPDQPRWQGAAPHQPSLL